MTEFDDTRTASPPKAVRLLLILVALTAAASILYSIQYFIGGPVQLAVVSEFHDIALTAARDRLAAGAEDGIVRLWDVPRRINTNVAARLDPSSVTPWPVRELTGHKAPVIEVGFTPDDKVLISVSDSGEVRRWDAETGQAIGELAIGGGPLVDAALDASGHTLAVVDPDGLVRVWDLASTQELLSFTPAEQPSEAVALSLDGARVAAAAGANIEIWGVHSGEQVQLLEGYWEDEETKDDWLGHDEEVTVLAFGPDGETLASGSADTTIIFWDIQGGEVTTLAEGHWATVTTIVFDEPGATILSGGRDNKTRNIRVQGGKSAASYEGHLNAITSNAYGPTADTMLSASDDGTVRVWATANQYTAHIEWSAYGFQSVWGRALAVWMLASGILGLLCLWGLWRLSSWSYLVALTLYVIGPIAALGLPLLELLLTYPLTASVKLQFGWPLLALVAWYASVDYLLLKDRVSVTYEAGQNVPLADQLVASQRMIKARFGILSAAVWITLFVVLYSVLRRFNLDVAFMGYWFPFIVLGAALTGLISVVSIILATILALLGSLGRLSNNPIANGLSSFYVSLIRGTPLLVQIFIWYLGLPRLGIILPGLQAGILALGVNYGAYMTEIFRAGIQAIGKGQHEAAQALGMSRVQTLRRIVLPQAFRIVIPPIGNEFIAMMKDSSLVSVMSVWELTFRAQKIGRQNFRPMETFIIAAAFYWVLTVAFQFLQGKLEEYMARSERR